MDVKRVLLGLLLVVSAVLILEVTYTNFQIVANPWQGGGPSKVLQTLRESKLDSNISAFSYLLPILGEEPSRVVKSLSRNALLLKTLVDEKLRGPTQADDLSNASFSLDLTQNGTGSDVHCLNISWTNTADKVHLPPVPEQSALFIKLSGSTFCFTPGTDLEKTISPLQNTKTLTCLCKAKWFGEMCSIPHVITNSQLPNVYHKNIKPRLKPRRIIHAFPFNIEFAMLESRLAEFGDLVDVFVVLESNFTAFGTPKEQLLYKKLKEGKYGDLACKLVYVFLDYFPPAAKKDGWVADALHRNFIGGPKGLLRIDNMSPSDIVILTDADEIPSREAILFLKYHEGYPEPFGFTYKWTIYGFFWENLGRASHDVCAGMTSGMLQQVLHRNMYNMRAAHKMSSDPSALNAYIKAGGNVLPGRCWALGSDSSPAGFHCSWCLDAEGIRTKLVSAQNGDFPRWGDFEAKRRIPYIENLVRTGTWFDDKSRYHKLDATLPGNAPSHVLANKEKYKHLIWNSYQ